MFANRIVLVSYSYSKYLQKFCPPGIYILPQFDDIKCWHGVIFIREGYYRDGIFKFEIHIPNEYPSKPPEVIFISKIFHSYIDQSSGKLDISVKYNIIKKKFVNWESGKNFIVQILYYIQSLFSEVSYFQDNSSFNPIAATMFNDNPKKFEEEISKFSKKSFDERYESKNTKSSIKFSKQNTKYHQIILDKILKQSKEVIKYLLKVETYDRIEDFKNQKNMIANQKREMQEEISRKKAEYSEKFEKMFKNKGIEVINIDNKRI